MEAHVEPAVNIVLVCDGRTPPELIVAAAIRDVVLEAEIPIFALHACGKRRP
jgi:hypothetical protein